MTTKKTRLMTEYDVLMQNWRSQYKEERSSSWVTIPMKMFMMKHYDNFGIWLTLIKMVMIMMRMIKFQSSVVMGARSRWPRYAATTTVRVPTTHEPTPPHPTFGLASLGFESRWCSFRGFTCNPNVTFALISLLWALTQVVASNFVVKTRVDLDPSFFIFKVLL